MPRVASSGVVLPYAVVVPYSTRPSAGSLVVQLTVAAEALTPVLSGGDDAVSYPDLATRLQRSPGAVRVAVHRVRQRYGEAVRMKVAELVQRPEDVEGELRHLFAALGGGP